MIHVPMIRPLTLGLLLMLIPLMILPDRASAAEPTPPQRFDFGDGPPAPGYTAVTVDNLYAPDRGYGFEPGTPLRSVPDSSVAQSPDNPLAADAITADAPFRFSVRVPEGNHRVTVTLGQPTAPSDTAVKAESRRLMTERIRTPAGEARTVTFDVNTRTPALASGGTVSLNDREVGSLTWDDKLTLEFAGEHPAVAGVTVEPNPDAVTVFLAGDSTVTDQADEPWTGWGQILPRFFKPGVAVANHAESGRSVRSFTTERRFDKILTQLRPGDYVLIQFGHNDMKETGEGIGPYESYAAGLRAWIEQARAKRATPVLVTPMHRRWFNDDGTVKDTFGDYPDAMRRVAAETNTPLINLQKSSRTLYEALGPRDSTRLFVHYPAGTFPDQPDRLKDDTHHNPYGGYLLARCIVEGMRVAVPDLAGHLVDDLPPFDPAEPPSLLSTDIPSSTGLKKVEAPEGS